MEVEGFISCSSFSCFDLIFFNRLLVFNRCSFSWNRRKSDSICDKIKIKIVRKDLSLQILFVKKLIGRLKIILWECIKFWILSIIAFIEVAFLTLLERKDFKVYSGSKRI